MSPTRPDLVEIWMFRERDVQTRSGAGTSPDDEPALDGASSPEAAIEILMLRRSRGRILPGLWQCVSGSMEPEEGIPDGALRELREETGFAAEQIVGFYDLDQINQFHEPSVHGVLSAAVFAVRLAAGSEPVLSHEHDAMRWVTPAEALALAIWPAYRESIRRITENLTQADRAIWFELTLEGQRVRA